MKQTRRSVLGAAGALIAGTAGASYVLADSHVSIKIEVHAEDEYVVLMNAGDEDIDLSEYTINFEYGNPEDDQVETTPEGTILEADGQLIVATGKLEVPNADVTFDGDTFRLNNEDPDTVALLTPEGEVVASTSINTTTTTTTTTIATEDEETTTEEEQTTTEEEKETTTTEDEKEPSDGDGSNGGEEEPMASVTFEDQDSDGTSVVIQHATLSDGGFLVIHDESGAVLGHSAYLDAGDHSNVEISLDSPITESQTLIAMAHTDDGDQTYEFPDADGPYTADGAPVTDDASITVC